VSLRSKGSVDVRRVAGLWQGGGHTNAAGFGITGPLDVIRTTIVDEIGRSLG
jgi:nanoRNase/pAp phosphatase (c-di-AMP/oligoRNAs hydrolase)